MKYCIIVSSISGFLFPLFAAAAELPEKSGLTLKPAADQSMVFHAAISLLIAVVLLIIVCCCLLWWKKRIKPAHGGNDQYLPAVKASRRITQKTTLITVVWQNKIYLLAESHGNISVIDSTGVEVFPS
jgi:hypothetical protein